MQSIVGIAAMVVDPQNGINPVKAGETRNQASANSVSAETKQDRPSADGAAEEKENVSLSQEAKSLGRLEAKIHAAPEVDSERVIAIKQALAEGTYEIDAERVAENLLQHDDLLV